MRTAKTLSILIVASTALSMTKAKPDMDADAPTTLVSDETIARQKKLTTIVTLDNGVTLVHRLEESSDLTELKLLFRTGIAYLDPKERTVPELVFAVLPMASKKYPKTEVFKLKEKYAIGIGCSEGIESSSCGMSTVNDYWAESIDLFADLVKNPRFDAGDISLQVERIVSAAKGTIQDPSRYVNEVVNRVYYEESHPYRLSIHDTIEATPGIKRGQLTKFHENLLKPENLMIAITTSMPVAEVRKSLNTHFGVIAGPEAKEMPKPLAVNPPDFKNEGTYSFEHREIPTAYIRSKFNGVGVGHKDEAAANLMIKIFDEELSEEIRTKRSLSYAVFSFMIQYTAGIGVISASTSKPKETLEAIWDVIRKMQTKKLEKIDLDEHKTVYATKYFLTQERHSALTSSILNMMFYKGSVDPLYELPRQLDAVTPEDIQRLANELLVNLRVGVVYDRAKFKDDWVRDLIKKSLAQSS